ncbi:MAG: hypothetical protein COW00_14175 [Bdellovibrio sp. CG12_big_fil_rev_8_21_14_0_65_39_13]|nr:MAG: hypothetical protein COW78_08080 [Bdellovibrio sp. CG22_combo_CG10-13_8_21_14_all_39_27]PIQ58760.1 MAG: hypothetical protein COW00_14175 [Bdellovibrio sp. CG12_big_fil_rev_8_21_14_0_65_39_13]PIR35559.1 MAG: hypothetical protein COV37_08785 [Bdellovibrio sp. CG11_big_fil_rev_8_21_14_0_20_39_38]PJB54313.1 MAG: hypothetical protein CO099_02345 [Bdellovibrio sp. CG_4_9_14_3_um_filter_39_7]
MIPMNIKIVVDQGSKPFRLWLPLWILFPLVLALMIVLLPIIAIVLFFFVIFKGFSVTLKILGALIGIFCALKGTHIEVDGKYKVFIQID